MCSEPITTNGVTFACRKCNQCITARKNDWVARCMAEKATTKQTIVIDLTYRNKEDGEKPDGAKAFNYRHIQLFLKALREEYHRHYKAPRNEVRYIIAGERGSKRDRVHWHLVLFAEKPLTILGEWQDFYYNPIKEMKEGKMLHWSYWKHGHVFPQTPDQGGMMYVLKYALKDQFNSVNSKGTMRFTKSEDNGASMFRMAKKPPIGFRWLEKRCNEWEAMGVVPTKIELKIPDYTGYWWPKGDQREYLLERLHNINKNIKKQTGHDAPQWNTLLASVVKNEKDWEGLHYGTLEENEEEYNHDYWEQYLKREQEARDAQTRAKETQRRCGGALICKPCWRGKSKAEKAQYHEWYNAISAQRDRNPQSNTKNVDDWYRRKTQINPFCGLKDTPSRKTGN